MGDHVRWLTQQLEGWVAKSLLSREQAGQIRKLYPEPEAALPWGMIIFSGIGVVIAGLGIILLLAYNWQAIPKEVKLAVIFGPLIAFHAVGISLFRGASAPRRQLAEALCLMGSMLFGAGIWLVAQIYHIEEHFPNGFLIWGLGVLALAWAMPSLAQALLATVLLGIWGCAEAVGFYNTVHWAPFLILLALVPLARRLESPFLLFFVLAAFFVDLLSNVGMIGGQLVVPVLLNAGALFVALRILTGRYPWFPRSEIVWGIFGWLGFLLSLYILTFPNIFADLLAWREAGRVGREMVVAAYTWVPFGASFLAWLAVARPWRPPFAKASEDHRSLWQRWLGSADKIRSEDCTLEHWLLPLAAIACQVFVARWSGEERPTSVEMWPVAGLFSFVFLALAAAWMARGCREGLLGLTVLGSLLLIALVVARYFDLFENLVARGLVFVVVGGVLIAEGILFRRARQRAGSPEVSR